MRAADDGCGGGPRRVTTFQLRSRCSNRRGLGFNRTLSGGATARSTSDLRTRSLRATRCVFRARTTIVAAARRRARRLCSHRVARDCSLGLNSAAVNVVICLLQRSCSCALLNECDETEPSGTAQDVVSHHHRCGDHPEGLEVIAQVFICGVKRQTADEEFGAFP